MPRFHIRRKNSVVPSLNKRSSVSSVSVDNKPSKTRVRKKSTSRVSASHLAPPEGKKTRHRRQKSVPLIDGDGLKYSEEDDFTKQAGQFESLDAQVTNSQTFQAVWKIVRKISAQHSYDKIVDVLEKDACLLVHADSFRFIATTADEENFIHGSQTYPIERGLCGYSYNRREIVCLTNPVEDKRYDAVDMDPKVIEINALMVIPVVADDNEDCTGDKSCIGVMIAVRGRDVKEPFNSRDCTALYRLGELAGNFLRTASQLDSTVERYKTIQRIELRERAMADIAKALGSENQLSSLIPVVVQKVPELLDCDRCTLYLVDTNTNELIVTRNSSHGRPKSFQSWIFGTSNAPSLPFPEDCDEIRLPMNKGIAGYVGSNGTIINCKDAHNSKRFNPEIDRVTGYRTRSVLCVPMRDHNDVVIGVIQAINKNPRYDGFSEEDQTTLQAFCAQAAVAVKNSRLFEQTQNALERSNALLEVNTALSRELKLAPLVRTIVENVRKLLNSQRCTVFIVDAEKQELYTSDNFSVGMGAALPINYERDDMIRFPMSRGIAGHVATTGEIINIDDAYLDSRFNRRMDKQTGFRTKSILCVPIKNYEDEVVGIIQAINKIKISHHNEKIGSFISNDVELLKSFAHQAALAIQNSRLLMNTERALNNVMSEQRQLRFLLNVTKNLFSDMHLSNLIEQMDMQVRHLLKADTCSIFLVDADKKEFYPISISDSSNKRYSFNTGIAGKVASTAKPIRISSQAFKDQNFNRDVDQRPGKITHSILCCPILFEKDDESEVVGIVSVRDEKDRGGFETEEESLLSIFCAQAAISLNKLKKFSKMLSDANTQTLDNTATEYLVSKRGLNLGGDQIESFHFEMDQVELLCRIGSGSYGEVYKGTVDNRIVAVKKLRSKRLKAENVEAFCNEAGLMCQLKHPNVVEFIGAVTEPQNLCIITEYCARGSLADLLLNPKVKISDELKLKIALEAARGMQYLHSSNPIILHRDLKSDNLLVMKDWTIKVADFGLTRYLVENKPMSQVGTPMWMAPEIILGKKYTEKADVYAFGIILWEILTRQEPYSDKEPMQIVVEVCNENLRPIVPAELENTAYVLLMKDCWHEKAKSRPTFKVIVERLQSIIDSSKDTKTTDDDFN